MTHSSLTRRLALLVAGATLLGSAGRAADTPILAFGDSITEGFGDDPSNPNPGYPPRLEGLLDGAGYPVRIANHGSGGETTAEGVSRIDSVLDEGGEILLLMEGTNDINRQISGETIRYNLNAIAAKAEARGLRVVHATVIPHRPDGLSGDVQNFATRDVRVDILGLAASQGRAVVDAFTVFWQEPDYASRFYVDLPPEIDPVGHPNPEGYDLLAEEFFPVVRDLLASGTGSGQIEVLTQPIVAGQLASFGVDLRGGFQSVTWRFGTDGWAEGRLEDGWAADFVFDRPGSFVVSVRAVDAAGRVVADSVVVTVGGPVPSWRSALSLVPIARRDHPAPGGLRRRTDLRLVNLGATPVRAEIALLAPTLSARDLEQRAATAPIAVGLRAGQTALLSDVLAALGVAEGAGALRVTALAATGAAAPNLEASVRILGSDDAGERSEWLLAVPEAEWSAGARFVGGLDATFGAGGAAVIANPEDASGTVDLELFDAAGRAAGAVALAVPGGSTLLSNLSQLFPALSGGGGPFGLRVASSGRRVAVGLEAAPSGGEDRSFVPLPVESNLPPNLFLPTYGNAGDGLTRRLAVFNPGLADVQLRFALLRLGSLNTSPPIADRTLAPGASLVIENPRAQLFGQGDGNGLIRVTWSGAGGVAPVVVGSAASADGRVGTALRGSAAAGIFYDQAVLALPPPNSAWTPVIGLMELESFPLTVRLELLDLRGESLGARNLQLLRRELEETALAGLFPQLTGTGWSLRVTLPDGGAVLAYVASRSDAGDLEVTAATVLAEP